MQNCYLILGIEYSAVVGEVRFIRRITGPPEMLLSVHFGPPALHTKVILRCTKGRYD